MGPALGISNSFYKVFFFFCGGGRPQGFGVFRRLSKRKVVADLFFGEEGFGFCCFEVWWVWWFRIQDSQHSDISKI